MSRRATIPVPNNRPEFAASEHFLYTAADHQLRSRTHDGTEVAVFGEGGKGICCPVLGPRGLLFCVLLDDADVDAVDEIFALDARCRSDTGSARCISARARIPRSLVGWWS